MTGNDTFFARQLNMTPQELSNNLVDSFCYIRSEFLNREALVNTIKDELEEFIANSSKELFNDIDDAIEETYDLVHTIQRYLMCLKNEFIDRGNGSLFSKERDLDSKIEEYIITNLPKCY